MIINNIMEQLPLDIEKIIMDYKYQLEITDKYDKIVKDIKTIKKWYSIGFLTNNLYIYYYSNKTDNFFKNLILRIIYTKS